MVAHARVGPIKPGRRSLSGSGLGPNVSQGAAAQGQRRAARPTRPNRHRGLAGPATVPGVLSGYRRRAAIPPHLFGRERSTKHKPRVRRTSTHGPPGTAPRYIVICAVQIRVLGFPARGRANDTSTPAHNDASCAARQRLPVAADMLTVSTFSWPQLHKDRFSLAGGCDGYVWLRRSQPDISRHHRSPLRH